MLGDDGQPRTLLHEQGLGLADLLRTTLYLVDYQDFEAINAAYSKKLAQPFPARATVQVAALPLGAKVQIDAVVRTRGPAPEVNQ